MDTKQNFLRLLGHNVRRVRVKRKLSIEKLSIEAGLAYSQISRIEHGAISTSAYTVHILSRIREVCPSEFYKDQNRDQQLSKRGVSEKP